MMFLGEMGVYDIHYNNCGYRGLAIGFGAQSLVKDVINGFLLFSRINTAWGFYKG